MLMPGCYIDVVKSPGADDQFYAAHGSRLQRLHLQGCILNPYSQPNIPSCNETCEGNLIALDVPRTSDSLPTNYKARNGLQFAVTWEQGTQCPAAAVVTMTGAEGSEPKRLVIPFEKHSNSGRVAVFLDKLDRLLVADGDIIMIWALPKFVHVDLTLLFLGHRRGKWGTCPHQQLFCPNLHSNGDLDVVQRLGVDQLDIINNSMHFLRGFDYLFNLDVKDRYTKERVERYVDRHINRIWHSELGKLDLLSYLRGPEDDFVERYHDMQKSTFLQFVAFAFGSSSIRWILRSDMKPKSNPVFIILWLSGENYQCVHLLEIVINYCFRQARIDQDMRFWLPVIQCLDTLINPATLYGDLALPILPRLTHFPVKSREFILKNHTIQYPPGLQLCFWTSDGPDLFECKDPVLQMVCGKEMLNYSGNAYMSVYFKNDLFAATFELLWRVKVDASSGISPRSRRVSSFVFLSLIMNLFHVFRHKFSLIHATPVRIHDFHLDMLDNPAIVALVAYKWNTIGFRYWLVRFFFQCCFYALVLVAVFKHIYDHQARAPAGLFVAILVTSSFFLWLEVAQMITNWKRYRSSMYNVVDLAVFGLPFAGSINQLYIISGRIQGRTANEGNAGIFSFAVIFIFLHILFELRVMKTVCYFVTIIIRVIVQIRIFFFVFTAGIIAFTIATLHILRACPFEECSEPTTMLPVNFFYALSATYFFMGGRYDAVNEDFNSENWQFHVLMMIYFFFTVILMLNVLIALINVAFSDGDETWRRVWTLNRLQVVESAENLSYHIPGYRQSSPWFPKEIYYSASKKQVREFREKYLLDDDQDLSEANRSLESDPEYPLATLQTQQSAREREMKDMRDQSKTWHGELQGQSTDLKTQNDELKVQLKALQAAFNAQTDALKAILKDMN